MGAATAQATSYGGNSGGGGNDGLVGGAAIEKTNRIRGRHERDGSPCDSNGGEGGSLYNYGSGGRGMHGLRHDREGDRHDPGDRRGQPIRGFGGSAGPSSPSSVTGGAGASSTSTTPRPAAPSTAPLPLSKPPAVGTAAIRPLGSAAMAAAPSRQSTTMMSATALPAALAVQSPSAITRRAATAAPAAPAAARRARRRPRRL